VAADGICLDAEGAVWVADAIHGRLIRVAEGGHILDELSTTEGQFYACALGGEDGRTLFACHASGPLDPASFARRRSASVRMARVEVAGAGWI
jgi:sugar lactone lactonase YvrE